MLFRQLFEAKSSTYTYLLADENTSEAIMIDPVLDEVPAYLQLLEDLNLDLSVAMDTHVHADHVTALGRLRELTACRTLMACQSQVACASDSFDDGEIISVGQIQLQALHTPGHTDDSYCFRLLAPVADRVFTGDTLLIRGTGRTDFQNGDASTQFDSLHKRLLTLPEDTLVYPGHDYRGWTVSTIAEERRCNPRLQFSLREDYVEFMANLNLPNPKQMDFAVPANRQCGEL